MFGVIMNLFQIYDDPLQMLTVEYKSLSGTIYLTSEEGLHRPEINYNGIKELNI